MLARNYVKFYLFLIIIVTIIAPVISFSLDGDDNPKLSEKSEFIYYLTITYDGKNEQIIASSDTTMIDMFSDVIYIEDELPYGLEFKGFEVSDNGTVGAVSRDDSKSVCGGYIEGDETGLHYDEETRKISFKIINLQAGCKLTVGIRVETPSLEDLVLDRLDFYNTASAKENSEIKNSNTIHNYIGAESEVFHKVIYKFAGDIPETIPALPNTSEYTAGSLINVENNLDLPGYIFSGWQTDDIDVSNGVFRMPTHDVEFTGTFTAKPRHKVTYEIDGVMPPSYVLPEVKEYYENYDVKLDTLPIGTEFDGYYFLGWNIAELNLNNGKFAMPNNDITIVGKFEKISYKLTYQFTGDILPKDAFTLPSVENYYPDDEIDLATINTSTICKSASMERECHFSGWASPYIVNGKIKMPDTNITITGTWEFEKRYFTPSIDASIISPKDYYNDHDSVDYQIAITNNEEFTIFDIDISQSLYGAYFNPGEGYVIKNGNAFIYELPANSTVTITGTYQIANQLFKAYDNKIEIKDAYADNEYYLDTSQNLSSDINFNVYNNILEIRTINKDNEILDGSLFTLYSDEELKNAISSGITFTNLIPGNTYYLRRSSIPTGYKFGKKIMKVKVDEEGIITIDDNNIDIEATSFIYMDEVEKINMLPNTGGMGNTVFIFTGLFIIGGSSIIYYFYRRRK